MYLARLVYTCVPTKNEIVKTTENFLNEREIKSFIGFLNEFKLISIRES